LLFSLWAAKRALAHPAPLPIIGAGLLAGLAGLTHPAVGPAWLISMLLFFAVRPSRQALVTLLAIILVTAVTVAPWLAFVVARYGVGVVLSAGTSHGVSETLGRLLTAGPSYIGILDLVLPLALLGIVVVLSRGEWLLPLWLVLLLAVPGGEGRYAAIAWALLAGVGAMTVAGALAAARTRRLAFIVGLSVMTLGAAIAGYQTFGSLSPQIREAMIAAGKEARAGTRFAVYADNAALETPLLDWFPTLSGQVSLGTFMGLEWTTSQRWSETVAIQHAIQDGEIPKDATAIFRVRNGVATWELLH
jgi:hypothetical protein